MGDLKFEPKFISDITVNKIQEMGGDAMVVAAARVSTSGSEAEEWAHAPADENYGLINYLIKHRHGTPFEHSAMTFFVHAPIFVWREWHRHRIGFCLSGDTQIWSESWAPKSGRTLRKHRLAELCERWNEGVKDSRGRVRMLPSVKNQKLRVLNEETHLFESGSIKDVFKTGTKELFQITTDDLKWNSLRCSKDHRILTVDGWAKTEELSGNEYIYVCGKRNSNPMPYPPSLRQGIGVWTSMQRMKLIKPTDRCYECDSVFCREELVLDHVVPVISDLLKALDVNNLKPMCEKCHRRKSNEEQKLSDRNIVAGSKLARLTGKPQRISEEMTYDIEMDGPWHNFVANGIVVHNSYNEESGRYKQLDPVFWIPSRERKLVPSPTHKSARPDFVRLDNDATYEEIVSAMKTSYLLSYSSYERLLEMNVAKEVSRACLPVATYSSCWVTCNPRSLMSFLSLRTHDKNAKYVSYPQAEIEQAARACEQILSQGWPLTYRSFIENGRVGP